MVKQNIININIYVQYILKELSIFKYICLKILSIIKLYTI